MKQEQKPFLSYLSDILPCCTAIAVIYGGYHLIEGSIKQRQSVAAVELISHSQPPVHIGSTPTSESVPSSHPAVTKPELAQARSPQDILEDIKTLQKVAGDKL